MIRMIKYHIHLASDLFVAIEGEPNGIHQGDGRGYKPTRLYKLFDNI